MGKRSFTGLLLIEDHTQAPSSRDRGSSMNIFHRSSMDRRGPKKFSMEKRDLKHILRP